MSGKLKRNDEDDDEGRRAKRSKEAVDENQRQRQRQQQGRAGRVIRICLRNFMCHSFFEIDLNGNINYVIGRNGSGKSAILTALIVGLGGKATTTSRGSNMQAFIQNGKSSATVEITLSNQGPMAYKPKTFGQTIAVERTFNETGTTRYKLKSCDGKTVSTQLRDLKRLTEALNIQVDNPICVLNQETARTFLNTDDTAKKYQLFMRATNLEMIRDQYNLSVKNQKATVATLNDKKKHLAELKKELDKWSKKMKTLESIDELEQKRRAALGEMLWAKVFQIEDEMSQEEEKIKRTKREIEKLSSMTQGNAVQQRELKENQEQIQRQLREIKQEFEQSQSCMSSAKERLLALNEQVYTKRKTIDTLQKMIERKQPDQETIRAELENFEKDRPNVQKIREERDMKMERCHKRMGESSDIAATAENDLLQIRNSLLQMSGKAKTFRDEAAHVDGKLAQLTAQIRTLKSESNNSLTVYGRLMPRLLDAINEAKEQFSQMPRGPIGSQIKLKDKKWALAIEEFIGAGMLQAFCVDNPKDMQVLGKILAKVFGNQPRPTIICSKFFSKVHDTSKYKTAVPPGCVALIDVLLISDPIIANCLIDQLEIESILLTPNSETSMGLMSQASNVPKNCTRTITIHGDQFYPDPDYRSYAARQKVAKYLQMNTGELLKQYEAEVNAWHEDRRAISEQAKAVHVDIDELKRVQSALEEKITDLNKYKAKLQNTIDELRLEELPSEKNVEILKEELAEIDRYIQNKQADIRQVEEEVKGVESEAVQVDGELLHLKKSSRQLKGRMDPLITQMTEIAGKLNALDKETGLKSDRLQQNRCKLVACEQQYNLKKAEREGLLENANEVSEKPSTRKTIEQVVKESEEAEQCLSEISMLMGDKQVVKATYTRISEKYGSVKLLVNEIEQGLDDLARSLDFRLKQLHHLTRLIGCRVEEMFCGILSVRGFAGKLEVDHKKCILDLVVVPQHGSQQSHHKHLLSGGERSYSTVAFLMALWQVKEYPFYFLDEFDVFMDKVNRRVVMDMLMDHGLGHKKLQFVFLTPQDISSVKTSDAITIHRMADPDRNQTGK